MRLIYCFDAYCTWCYGFSPVMKKLEATIGEKLPIEVLSGGMLIADKAISIALIAPVLKNGYENVEETTGVKFGADFLWHINNTELSDWFPSSMQPAIALCIIKEMKPVVSIAFATDMEYGLYYEGRDLTDPEAYRHLLVKYEIEMEAFYDKFFDPAYEALAQKDFALVRQLGVDSYPVLLLQISDDRFYMVAKGYTAYETIIERINQINNEIKSSLN